MCWSQTLVCNLGSDSTGVVPAFISLRERPWGIVHNDYLRGVNRMSPKVCVTPRLKHHSRLLSRSDQHRTPAVRQVSVTSTSTPSSQKYQPITKDLRGGRKRPRECVCIFARMCALRLSRNRAWSSPPGSYILPPRKPPALEICPRGQQLKPIYAQGTVLSKCRPRPGNAWSRRARKPAQQGRCLCLAAVGGATTSL